MPSCEKVKQNTIEKNVGRKRSIFFNISYLKCFFVRYCIDVMHIEKNVCDSIIGTLLNISGKAKDKSKINWIWLK